ncbi:response regulator [Aquibium carbonis]|uniref:Response regulator n=1 Tax=Aquibium carbonis TaxID=2495581 RepID=A0A429Z318_9HYPH|nr:response regulator FixJ [Aquibium carbonis]RST88089.1 response regulator [Aquibium carbonis]
METGEYVVHIVDDEEPVRKSLAFMLTIAGFPVRMHESAAAFLAAAPGLRNACLVTDLRMPEINGVDLIRRLRDMAVSVPSIVITGHGDVPMAVEAMKAGALDFIEKPFEDEVLIAAITRAAAELDRQAATQDSTDILRRLEQLTDREREVLAAVVAGHANKTIAYDLNISPRTVEVHRANVMAKMDARSLPELVRMALAAGIVPK